MKFSTRLIRKGALINETRAILKRWSIGKSVSRSVEAALAGNPVGARSAGWLREIRTTLSSRFTEMPSAELDSLVALARSESNHDVWTACLHWHNARTDSLYYNFVLGWLYDQYEKGAYRLQSQDVLPFVNKLVRREKGHAALSEYGALRAARDLLRMATDFGLLTGALHKEFASYHLPEESFMYLLHAMAEVEPNARRIVDAEGWRLFLMDTSEVERELLRLHQFRKVHYEVAGSLAQLKLPCGSSADYARELCA